MLQELIQANVFSVQVDVDTKFELIVYKALDIRYCTDSIHSCEASLEWLATNGATQLVVFTITTRGNSFPNIKS